jgi:hypothetical protein
MKPLVVAFLLAACNGPGLAPPVTATDLTTVEQRRAPPSMIVPLDEYTDPCLVPCPDPLPTPKQPCLTIESCRIDTCDSGVVYLCI